MKTLFDEYRLGNLSLANRFVFPPVKLGSGNKDGTVSGRQIQFYRKISENGPAIVILEPVSVTPDGKEHPKQLCIHLPGSADEIKKICNVVHEQNRLVCLHLNHAGAAATSKASGSRPFAPSVITCPKSGDESGELSTDQIRKIIEGYENAAQKAAEAGCDLIEVQAGHGYLISQFLNRKINVRKDEYGEDRLLFARGVLSAVKKGAGEIPFIVRISADEMSDEAGINREDILPLMKLAEDSGAVSLHAGMGNACFSPPWYFHHGSLPEKPQIEALSWLRRKTSLPVIAAGRMGRKERIRDIMDNELADLIAMGRPLIADPDLIEKWRAGRDDTAIYCGYCLQGCLHRMQSGQSLGCNLNPETGLPPMEKSGQKRRVLVVGGGPSGISAALFISRRGHHVTLVEKNDYLGGNFSLAWKAPGKSSMKDGLDGLIRSIEESDAEIMLNTGYTEDILEKVRPDVLVWATGSLPDRPEIPGLEKQNVIAAPEFIKGEKEVAGPRILVIGAGRTGLEIAEGLGGKNFEVVATKRTDPIGGTMPAIEKKLALKRIEKLPDVTLMPRTTINSFNNGTVQITKDGSGMSIEGFQTVILASGMKSAPGPDEKTAGKVPRVEIIGDAGRVSDIFNAVQDGYFLARKY